MPTQPPKDAPTDLSTVGLDFSNSDLDAFLDGAANGDGAQGAFGFVIEVEDTTNDAEDTYSDIGDLCRRIAAQYADLVAAFAARELSGNSTQAGRDQIYSVIRSIRRLASAAEDTQLISVISKLETLLDRHSGSSRQTKQRLRSGLRDWLLLFADCLHKDDAARVTQIVQYDFRTQPLLKELASIRGIGKRRLDSLYCAGLFEVEVVCSASPREIADVTGMPQKLAERVVSSAQQFAEDERKRCIEDLRRSVTAFARVVPNMSQNQEKYAELLQVASASLAELGTLLAQIEPQPPRRTDEQR